VEKLKALQREIHESFIALVQERRGAKLNSRETALFSGAYWTGQRGLELGLVDAVGDLRTILRERYGEKVRTPLIAERGLFGRRTPGGQPRPRAVMERDRASPKTWLRRSRRGRYGRATDCRRS
jgi:ClpP class serine protease